MPKVKDLQKYLKESYKPNDEIGWILWLPEDVEAVAEDNGMEPPTEDEVEHVLACVVDDHDSTLGVTWDTLQYWLGYYREKMERNKELKKGTK